MPLDVTHEVNGGEKAQSAPSAISTTLSVTAVNYIISLRADGNWSSYLGDSSAGTAADAAIGDDTGLVAVMNKRGDAACLTVKRSARVACASISLNAQASNLVGVPLEKRAD